MDSDEDTFSESESSFDSGSESDDFGSENDVHENISFLWSVVDADQFTRPRDIVEFSCETGPRKPPEKSASPIDYFTILSSSGATDLIDIMVEETNRYARETLDALGEDIRPFSRMRKWEDVTKDEMSAFIGLWLAMGIIKKPTIASYWSSTNWLYDVVSFKKVMNRDRFELILKFLHASNNENYVPRGRIEHDPAYKVRRVLDVVNEAFKTSYNPGRDLTVDESMVGFKGRNYLVQYLPAKKSHRWGAKLWILAESDTGYTLSIDLYAGKRNTRGSHHVNGLGFEVVTRLTEEYFGKHHHVVIDNAFNSPTLCKYLMENDTYATGTVRDTRKGMPRSFRSLKLEKGERVVRQSGDIMALKYGDRRNVSFLSTMTSPALQHYTNSRGKEVEIPSTVCVYNRLMGGVDSADQQIHTYDPDIKSLKMWKKILMNILQRIFVNSYILYTQNRGLQNKMKRFEFTSQLYQELIGNYREERNRCGRPSAPAPLRLTERHFVHYIPNGKRKTCRMCSAKVRTWCPSQWCGQGLCVGNCFQLYHTRRNVMTRHED